jgi:hypothetical protein
MTPDREQSLRDRHVAIGKSPCSDGLMRQVWFELPPKSDPFQQSARAIHPWETERKCCVHMEMGVNKRRRKQSACCIDFVGGTSLQAGRDRHYVTPLNPDVDPGAAVRQIGTTKD